MPQPDSSRYRSPAGSRNSAESPWPVDPEAPERMRLGGRPARRPEKPEQDGRVPQDPDGNEELEREQDDREAPGSRPTHTERSGAAGARASRWDAHYRDFETEDTGEWVATERFTLEDELEDTWPNAPARFFDD